MKKKKSLICGFVLICVLITVLIATRLAAKALSGLSGVVVSNVASVSFMKNLGTPQSWETSDPEIIDELLEYFNTISVIPAAKGVGEYLGIRIYLKEPIEDKEFVDITLLSPTNYMGYCGPTMGYRVILGAKSDEEWDTLLKRCNKTN